MLEDGLGDCLAKQLFERHEVVCMRAPEVVLVVCDQHHDAMRAVTCERVLRFEQTPDSLRSVFDPLHTRILAVFAAVEDKEVAQR